ncbi:MAG: C40 family peptidase [Firmicutes bacterium]|nr:C40 family peptidase [Bacillota bacterium]
MQSREQAPGLFLAAIAMSLIGKPFYERGASPDTGFDCAGLVSYALSRIGIDAPHSLWPQYRLGVPVSTAHMKPGNLLFFSTYASGPTHVGIYVGEGRFVHCTDTRGVMLARIYDPFFAAHLLGARCLTVRKRVSL